ncbi:type IV secretion system protein [Neisseriaceae bacterium ESL0693]|nr:type IV secretion system protein [Neisseriaceae bacterium ESL0693]
MKFKSKNKPSAPTKTTTIRDANMFIQSARSFEQSEIDSIRRNNKIAWRVAAASLVLTGLALGAIAGLTPLKERVPFVIRVDNNTGATDIVTTIKKSEQSYGEIIDKYWLAQYIRFRESYDWQTIQNSYDATMLLSDDTVQKGFAAIYNDNPSAPHLILKDRFKVITTVKAISFIGRTAQIRFDKQRIPVSGDQTNRTPPQKLIATITYEYSDKPLQEKDRLINPLGFMVTSYRVDPEV